MLLYVLKLNQNAKMPEAYGKYYAYPVITQTVGTDGLAGHMASHNTPFSKGAIKGMITDMVSCIKELTLQGIAVKIDDLAIFSIGIRNKEGAASEKEFTIAKNIDGFRLRARGTGEFSAKTIQPRCYAEEGHCSVRGWHHHGYQPGYREGYHWWRQHQPGR